MGCSSPFQGHWARRWIDHRVCDAWPVRRRTYSYLPGCRASPPFGRYQIILLGDRGTWVWTTCPELLLGSVQAGSRTRDLSITSQRPNHWATEPPLATLTILDPNYNRLSLLRRNNSNINITVCTMVSPFSEHKADCCRCAWRGTCILVPQHLAVLTPAQLLHTHKHTRNDTVMYNSTQKYQNNGNMNYGCAGPNYS